MSRLAAIVAADWSAILQDFGESVTHTPHEGDPVSVTAIVHRGVGDVDFGRREEAVDDGTARKIAWRVDVPTATIASPGDRDTFTVDGLVYSIDGVSTGAAHHEIEIRREVDVESARPGHRRGREGGFQRRLD